MAASWPSAKKTFSAVVNGINKLVALLWNTGYDEIEAIETFIGASGNAQTKNAALINMFRSFLNPIPKVARVDNTTVSIEGKAVVFWSGNNYVIRYNSTSINIVMPTNLDTGAEANSTWYYIYLVADATATTYAAVFSTNASAPTGYTYYKLIGQVYNNSSGNFDVGSVSNDVTYLGAGVDKSAAYGAQQAATDGFVVVRGTQGEIQAFTDSAADPTTMYGWISLSAGMRATITMPVKKNNYWKVVLSGGSIESVYWIPLNLG